MKYLFLISIIFFGSVCAGEKDIYQNNGEICYLRSGKYRAEVCRKPNLNEDITKLPYKSSNFQPPNVPQNDMPSCQSLFTEKYTEVLVEANNGDKSWINQGYDSPRDYAKSRAALWVTQWKKQYRGCY